MKIKTAIKDLKKVPGFGDFILMDLINIGIYSVTELKGKNPEILFDQSNQFAGTVQDRCVLYVFRCAVYYAETEKENKNTELLKWWNWKDKKNNKKLTKAIRNLGNILILKFIALNKISSKLNINRFKIPNYV